MKEDNKLKQVFSNLTDPRYSRMSKHGNKWFNLQNQKRCFLIDSYLYPTEYKNHANGIKPILISLFGFAPFLMWLLVSTFIYCSYVCPQSRILNLSKFWLYAVA